MYVRPNFVSWAKYIENNCAKLDTFLCSARSVLEKMIGRTALVQRTMQEMLGKYLENNHQTGNNTGGRYGKSVIRCTKHGLPKKKGQKMLKNTLNTTFISAKKARIRTGSKNEHHYVFTFGALDWW